MTVPPSFPPLPSLLPPSLHQKKEEGTFYYKSISGEGIILHYSFIIIQKNRRRVKLQSLQFYINSKTIKLQRVKSVIILAAMVSHTSGMPPASHPRFHDASAVCCRDQAQEPSALGWLERQFLQQALMCRSVEVFGSHVGFVLGALHLSQTNDFVTNGVLDPQPSDLNVFCLSNALFGSTSRSLLSSPSRHRC